MSIQIKGKAKGHNLVNIVDRAVTKAKAEPQNLTAHEWDTVTFKMMTGSARIALMIANWRAMHKGCTCAISTKR
jgi:hypothetical protein